MSKLYVRLLAIAATLIAVTGAFFSIAGLTKLFAGSAKSVALMAGALEFAKLVVTGFLYRYWGHISRPLRVYMTFAVVTLVFITSLGIFGYLSNAYQAASLTLKTEQIKIQAIENENQRVVAQMQDIRKFIDEIPKNRVSKRLELQREYDPQLRRLQRRSDALLTEVTTLKTRLLSTNAELGPIVYVAEATGTDPDSVVRVLILIFVLVFDPLAVCLVFCLNLAIRLREKYRGSEARIAAHSLSTPVDHRFKKAG